MSKKTKYIIIFFTVFLICLVGFYFGMVYYYSHPSTYFDSEGRSIAASSTEESFLYDTNINGIYCKGMSVEQLSNQLIEKYEKPVYKIKFEGKEYDIDADDIGFSIDYKTPLTEIIKKQNAFMWPKMVLEGTSYYDVKATTELDETMLESVMDSIGVVESTEKKEEMCIELTDEGYVLRDYGKPILKVNDAREYIKSQILDGNITVAIDDSFYDEYKYTADEIKLSKYFDEIEKFQRRYVAYIFGSEKKTISKRDWAELINTEEPVKKIKSDLKGSEKISFEIAEDKAVQFIDEFLDEYNSLNNKYFTTHSGAVVYVTKGIYGNKLDIAREEKWFKEFVNSSQTSTTRAPVYLHEAKYKEKNDFGNTYIEISLDEQHMWYYVDGKVFVETDITSGGPAVGGTYPRVCYIQNKIPKKWLNGPTWHVFVQYWMAIDGSIGIHDSSWRDVYGGTEYMTNGSHGCINTPFDAMQKIFDNIEVGTPVIVYSVEKNGVDNKS